MQSPIGDARQHHVRVDVAQLQFYGSIRIHDANVDRRMDQLDNVVELDNDEEDMDDELAQEHKLYDAVVDDEDTDRVHKLHLIRTK